jgi:large subunit ribosomal protein L23
MEILLKPLVTEKMTTQGEEIGRYGFIVANDANKLQIRNAIEETYGVKVACVNTMKYAGKIKTRYTKTGIQTGSTKAFKKAIVTLVEGETIDFYSNI